MMNFTQLAQRFLQITEVIRISSNAQCLYFRLLNFFNKHFGETTFKLDNMTIANQTGLSREKIRNARNELEKYGLIYYEKGTGSSAGKYTIIDIQNARLDSIIDISNIDDVKIDNLTALKNEVDKLVGDYRIWGQYILKVLQNSIQNETSGIYGNYYATSQLFLKASDTIKFETLRKIIMHMRFSENIQNKEAYILTVIANEVKQLQREQKQNRGNY